MRNAEKGRLRLYLVRHGETAENARMSYLGIRDEPLNERGMWQAYRAAEALSQFPLRLIVSSPLRRAADTATRIQEASGVELITDMRLAEGSFGRWEGLTRDEVLRLGPKDAEMLAQWESDPSYAPPEGESLEDQQKRVVQFIDELQQEHENASIVMVSHVGPIKALLTAAMGIPLQASRRMFLDPGTISVVEWGAYPFLRLFNSHAHLGWSSARWMR
jgi:ribonuclease H / adenosylcobalamin/alpha-ribazole phosphatase